MVLVLDAAASRCDLYSDGALVATDIYVDGTTSFGTQSLNIGGFGDANRLQSVIDDVRLYNTALTQAEVQALAAGSLPRRGRTSYRRGGTSYHRCDAALAISYSGC